MSDDLIDRIRRDLESSLYTSAIAGPMPSLRAEDILKQARRLMVQERKTRVTFVVDLAHEGPIVGHYSESDGHTYELSWMQAQQLHQRVPLKMVRARSEHCAEFRPATVFDAFVPKVLDMPPYDCPDADAG